MKNFKRIASAVAAIALAATMAVPMSAMLTASAEQYDYTGVNYSITISEATAGYTYVAYQLFAGTDNGTAADTKFMVTGWGNDVVTTSADALVASLQEVEALSDVAWDTLKDDNKKGAGNTEGWDLDAIANAVSQKVTSTTVVDAIVAQLKTDSLLGAGTTVTSQVDTTGDGKGDAYVIELAAAGYYYVENTVVPPGYTAGSAQIIQVVKGNKNAMNPKSAKPTVDKQVWDNEGGDYTPKTNDDPANATNIGPAASGAGWYESADHQINKSFQFKLTATIGPDQHYAAYNKNYSVIFNDTFSKGITFESMDSIKVGAVTIHFGVDNKTSANNDDTNYYFEDIADFNSTNKWGAKIYLGTTGTTAMTENKTTSGGETEWRIEIPNIYLIDENINLTSGSATVIDVIYNAHLNEEAQVLSASGEIENNNKVDLSYSNKPGATGTSEANGKTPEDYVWVATYEIDDKKVDGSNGNAPLAGAGFNLCKNADGTGVIPLYYDSEDNCYYVYNADINTDKKSVVLDGTNGSATVGVPTTVVEDQKPYQILTIEGGKINIKGLDVGTYYLKETQAPSADYQLPTTAFEIVITAKHQEGDGTNDPAAITNMGYADLSGSKNNNGAEIINRKGTELPETGGIGTTLFYLIGGTLVVGAGVTLITKKRMQKD